MKNEEKYKTAEEREEAYLGFCNGRNCRDCIMDNTSDCRFFWLELEAEEEKPLSCPFCGFSETHVREMSLPTGCFVDCSCGYKSASYDTAQKAIEAHNRVARAVQRAEESEVKQ